MLEKITKYLNLWNKKPSYHLKSSTYGGFRLDIDQYYAKPENRKKLKQINDSAFPDVIKNNNSENEIDQKNEAESKLQR